VSLNFQGEFPVSQHSKRLPPRSLGTGLAASAGRDLKLRQAYNKYRIEAALGGGDTLTFAEFKKQFGGKS